MVSLRDDNLRAAHWRLGRIIKLQPGNNQIVRAIDVKCAIGEFKRPVSKLFYPWNR